jgi:hypothetical protein
MQLLGQALVEDGFCVADAGIFESFGSVKFQAAANEIYDCMEEHYLRTGRNIDTIKLLDLRRSRPPQEPAQAISRRLAIPRGWKRGLARG